MEKLDTIEEILNYLGIKLVKKNMKKDKYENDNILINIGGKTITIFYLEKGQQVFGVAMTKEWGEKNIGSKKQLIEQVRLELRKNGIVK